MQGADVRSHLRIVLCEATVAGGEDQPAQLGDFLPKIVEHVPHARPLGWRVGPPGVVREERHATLRGCGLARAEDTGAAAQLRGALDPRESFASFAEEVDAPSEGVVASVRPVEAGADQRSQDLDVALELLDVRIVAPYARLPFPASAAKTR